jgi:hypothetical protein
LLQNVFEVDLDIKQKTAIKMPTVTQNDTVVFVCRIFDDGRIYNIQSGTTFTMTATRPDKVTVITEGSVTDENIVEFTLGTTELAVAGKVNTVVQVYDAEGRISTIPFGYYVLNDPSTDYIPSEHEETLIERVLGDGPQVIDDATQAGDYAQSVADENKTTWLTPVATYEDIVTTYVEPNHGDTVQVLDTGKIYRYTSGNWAFTQAYSSTQLNAIQNQLSEQEQQTQTLQNGLNVLSSDQASPLKVEFYGVTRANLLGRDGGFEYGINGFNSYAVTSSIDSTVKSFGSNSAKITLSTDGAGIFARYLTNVVEDGGYYLAVAYVRNGDATNGIRIGTKNGIKATAYYTGTEFTQIYLKINVTTADDKRLDVIVSGTTGQYAYVDGIALFKISQATYDKIGDLSLIGKDQEFVEKAFPYVSGIQSVVNPVVKVSGANQFESLYEKPFSSSDFKTINAYELEIDATSGTKVDYRLVKVMPNQQYSFSIDSANGEIAVYDNATSPQSIVTYNKQITFNSGNRSEVRLYFRMGTGKKDTIKNIMFNLGLPRPFVPKNDSYLYAYQVNEAGENEPLILAGNDDKKDISFYNESTGRWEKRGWFEIDRVMDGSLSWTFSTDFIGFKNVYADVQNGGVDNSEMLTKFNGKLLRNVVDAGGWVSEDISQIIGKTVSLNISDTDTGFSETYTPTSDDIKRYFNGWKYVDGITWNSVTGNGETATASTTLTTKPSDYTPYKLTYQLAEPIVEEVRVEGDLSIQGDAQVSISEGLIVREKANPTLMGGSSEYRINNKYNSTTANFLKNRVAKIIGVYKQNVFDSKWTIVNQSHPDINGFAYAKINETDFDPNATYTVTYEILDKHDFTTNLNEVVAYYNSSIKSSFQSVVAKQSDIATDQTILKRQMLDVLVRLDALEGTE